MEATGHLIVCSYCHKILNGTPALMIEQAFHADSNNLQSHGICVHCLKTIFPHLADRVLKKIEKYRIT